MGLTNLYANEISGTGKSFLVNEKNSSYTNHDRLFKQLIKVFFKEFLEAFFPDIHGQIDFKKVSYLSEEMFTYDGEKRVVDLVVEVKWKETDAAIVVHIEPQSYVQSDFNERMFKYYGLLYNKLNKPIIPIAIFSYNENWDKDEFQIKFLEWEVVRFNYFTLHLGKQNWHHFIKMDNPVSAALLSKMGYSEKERVLVKLEFFKILARLKIDMEKEKLLVGFFESYLKLSEEEEEIFMEEARKLENADEVLGITVSYEEKGKEKGRKQGLQEGLQEGKKEVAAKMLEENFPIEKIVELTGLDRREIKELKQH